MNAATHASAKDVFALRKSGRRGEAIAAARDLVGAHPDDMWSSRALGWCLHDEIKERARTNDTDAVSRLLHEYMGMPYVERPSLLHSVILSDAISGAASWPGFGEFFRWWDPACFRPEDYSRDPMRDGAGFFHSLSEKAAKALFKSLKGGTRNAALIDCATGFLADVARRFPDNEWLEYYHGKALILAGAGDEARARILPIVRAKPNEFWAWSLLADTFEESASRLVCLARAAICTPKDPAHLVNVHEALAQTLADIGLHEAAAIEAGQVAEIRRAKGWKSSPAADALAGAVHINASADAVDRHCEQLRSLAESADGLLYGDLPWLPATIVGRKEPDGDRAGLTFVLVQQGADRIEAAAHEGRVPAAKNRNLGDPVSVRCIERDDRRNVVAMVPRDGEPWDLFPVQSGVISGKQPDHGRTWICLAGGRECPAYHERFPNAECLRLGSAVSARVRRNPKTGKDVLLWVQPSDEAPDASVYRIVKGEFRAAGRGGFGFVENMFVSPDLVSAHGLDSGMTIEAGAIKSWDRSKSRPSWKVLDIRSIQPRPEREVILTVHSGDDGIESVQFALAADGNETEDS